VVFVRWMVCLVLSGLGCRAVRDTRHADPLAPPTAPSCEIRFGLEWVDGRDQRARSQQRQDPAPELPRPQPTLRAPLRIWPETSRLPAILAEPPPGILAPPIDKPRRPADRRGEAKALRPHRDAPERVLDRYLFLLQEGDRLEKAFGYGRLRGCESTVTWSDPELPILVRDREQFGERLTMFGRRMFFRPAEKSLSELDFYRDAKLGLEDVKKRVFTPDSGSNWGTWTARFRSSSPAEAVEISYRLAGLRVGSTGGSMRASCDQWLLPWLRLEVGSRFPYDPEEVASLGAALHCHLSRWVEVHLVGSTATNRDMLPSLFMLSDPSEPMAPGGGIYLIYRF
jgi:hypothetical protein